MQHERKRIRISHAIVLAAAAVLLLVPHASAQGEGAVAFRDATSFDLDVAAGAEVQVVHCSEVTVGLSVGGLNVGLHATAEVVVAVIVDGERHENPHASCVADGEGGDQSGEESTDEGDAESGVASGPEGDAESASESSDDGPEGGFASGAQAGAEGGAGASGPIVAFDAEGNAVTFVSVEGLEHVVVVLCAEADVELDAAGLVDGAVHQETQPIAEVLLVTGAGTEAVANPFAACAPSEGVCPGPHGLAAEAHETHVGLAWDAVAGAEAYRVYRADGPGEAELIATIEGETTFKDEEVEAGSTYTYFVTALTADGETEACSMMESTAMPVFPSLIAAVAGTIGAVGAYAIGRRRV